MVMQSVVTYLAFSVAILGMAAASPGVTIDSDTVVDATSALADVVLIDGEAPPTSLTIVDGGLITGTSLAIDAYGSSEIEVLGGTILSGDIGVRLNDQSRLFVTGGLLNTISFNVEAHDTSQVKLAGGEYFNGFAMYDSSEILIANGSPRAGRLFNESRLVMTGGAPEDVHLFDESSFVLNRGVIRESFQANGNSLALIKSGGAGSGVILRDQAVVTFRGGNLTETVRVFDDAILHLYGRNLRFELDDDIHVIVGELEDGTVIQGARYNFEAQSQIILHEVPEPGAAGLLAVAAGAMMLLRIATACRWTIASRDTITAAARHGIR